VVVDGPDDEEGGDPPTTPVDGLIFAESLDCVTFEVSVRNPTDSLAVIVQSSIDSLVVDDVPPIPPHDEFGITGQQVADSFGEVSIILGLVDGDPELEESWTFIDDSAPILFSSDCDPTTTTTSVSPGGGELPATGTSLAPIAGGGAAAIAAGALLAVASKRRLRRG
jgi:LPXTG-motif cell wall-anchored protein